MSTRCQIAFAYEPVWDEAKTPALIYRHSDGYPDGAGTDLLAFFDDVSAASPTDTRFNDPEYLASRFVVWLTQQYAAGGYRDNKSTLAQIGIGVSRRLHGDIEYLYVVHCGGSFRPAVLVYTDLLDGKPRGKPMTLEDALAGQV